MTWSLGWAPLCATRCGQVAIGELEGEPLCCDCVELRLSDDVYSLREEHEAGEREVRRRQKSQAESRLLWIDAEYAERHPEPRSSDS